MTKYTTDRGETISAENYFSCTTTLGMSLVRTDDGRIFDVEAGERVVEITAANIAEVEQNVVDWLDDKGIESADDFTGEMRTDWDYVKASVAERAHA